jgi:hypothetical protein
MKCNSHVNLSRGINASPVKALWYDDDVDHPSSGIGDSEAVPTQK